MTLINSINNSFIPCFDETVMRTCDREIVVLECESPTQGANNGFSISKKKNSPTVQIGFSQQDVIKVRAVEYTLERLLFPVKQLARQEYTVSVGQNEVIPAEKFEKFGMAVRKD